MQKISTPDLSDLNPSVPFVGLQFNSYGARDFLYGPIKTCLLYTSPSPRD